ncbi:MAG: heparin lyase I family protein [Actinobacteria bacterium]|nr:heparin lyase I family protein [Actinomycetota bacterium]
MARTPTHKGGACPLHGSVPLRSLPMTIPGCHLVASDTAAKQSPIPFWGQVFCQTQAQATTSDTGGAPESTATGAAQGNSAARTVTVFDGDNDWGERCELGENDWRDGPTTFYHQGQRRATYFSLRLPQNFPLNTNNWQTVMQMKQAQPSDGGGGAPILEMEARQGKWVVVENWHDLFSFPARKKTWTRFAWDVYYSQNPAKGWLQVSADLNGDGDFNDPGERSPVFHVATLKTEIEGPNGASDGLAAGQPIPSHLRMGIYHDPAISCPAPTGCSVELDDVQVLR